LEEAAEHSQCVDRQPLPQRSSKAALSAKLQKLQKLQSDAGGGWGETLCGPTETAAPRWGRTEAECALEALRERAEGANEKRSRFALSVLLKPHSMNEAEFDERGTVWVKERSRKHSNDPQLRKNRSMLKGLCGAAPLNSETILIQNRSVRIWVMQMGRQSERREKRMRRRGCVGCRGGDGAEGRERSCGCRFGFGNEKMPLVPSVTVFQKDIIEKKRRRRGAVSSPQSLRGNWELPDGRTVPEMVQI
jgi:hypothetical protein